MIFFPLLMDQLGLYKSTVIPLITVTSKRALRLEEGSRGATFEGEGEEGSFDGVDEGPIGPGMSAQEGKSHTKTLKNAKIKKKVSSVFT